MVSIIIPTYNKLDLTKKCLHSIFSNTKEEYEVIVVDNASTDGTQKLLKKENIKLISNRKNLGFSKANNIGAENAKGEILVFLNNDTEVTEGWLSSILKVFNADKKVGVVGVKLLFPDNKVQHAGVVFSVDKVPRHIYYKSNSIVAGVNKKRQFQAVTAACTAIPKNVFNLAGGFDAEYINGLEDIDLCLRIREMGYRIIYQPEAVVIHHESSSPGRFNHNKHNADYYMGKWKNVESDEHGYYREDGLSWLRIFYIDLKNMAYSTNDYGTLPTWIRAAKYFYIPAQKSSVIIKLLITLDFKTLGKKIKKVINHA